MALPSRFRWRLTPPLIAPLQRAGDTAVSVKDPSVVYDGGRWHVFCSVRSEIRTHQTEHVTFESWDRVAGAERRLLSIRDGYACAPQVFYFRPHGRWYLVHQVIEQGRRLGLQPAYSTTATLAEPDSWTPSTLFFPEHDPPGVERWIDFWVICDDAQAYLFFTSLDGRLWRMTTALDAFPHGFAGARCVLTEDHAEWRLYEASHTYRLKGEPRYVTIVEGQDRRHNNRRFFLAYAADRLDGEWRPLAAAAETPFASCENVETHGERWADHISHGELIRDGVDETLTVDPAHLQFLIQGTTEASVAGKKYGEIPWRLGLLTHADTWTHSTGGR